MLNVDTFRWGGCLKVAWYTLIFPALGNIAGWWVNLSKGDSSLGHPLGMQLTVPWAKPRTDEVSYLSPHSRASTDCCYSYSWRELQETQRFACGPAKNVTSSKLESWDPEKFSGSLILKKEDSLKRDESGSWESYTGLALSCLWCW